MLAKFNLVACAEAAIKADYFERVQSRLKDSISLAYRAWHKKLNPRKKHRPDFDERGILDVLRRTNGINKHLIGSFRECLPSRHWIGHGRLWLQPHEIDKFDILDIYERSKNLLDVLLID